MAQINADLSDVSGQDGGARVRRCFEPGEYLFQILESDYTKTSAGNGMVLKLVFDCMEPGRRGKVFERLTLEHPNAETVRIARAQLKAIAIATGHPSPDFIRASEELHHKPVILKLRKVRANKGYGDDEGFENQVIGVMSPGATRTPASNGYQGERQGSEPPPIDDKDLPF